MRKGGGLFFYAAFLFRFQMFRRKNRPLFSTAPETAYSRGVKWSMAGSVCSAVFQFLQMVVFARLASPADMGDPDGD